MIDMNTPGFTVLSKQLLDPNWMQKQQVKAGTQPIKIYQHYVTVSSFVILAMGYNRMPVLSYTFCGFESHIGFL